MVKIKFVGKHSAPVWYHTQGRTKYKFSTKVPLREVAKIDAERLIENYPGKFEIVKAAAKPEAPKPVKKDGDK